MSTKPGRRDGIQVRVIAARDLAPSQIAAWSAWQGADATLANPFFRPEFTLAVGAVREDARVAVLEEAGEPAGFFPFQAAEDGTGGPIVSLSDYQGVIARPQCRWDPVRLIRDCGLQLWRFDHLLAAQQPFAGFHRVLTSSPVIDLSAGYEAYVEERRRAGTEQIKKVMGLRRKLEREAGPVRVETHVAEHEVLKLLMRWKSDQYLASGKTDIFALPWAVELIERIMASQHDSFGGMLSVLYANGRPVAAHFGMRSQKVWHYWFPSYDRAYEHYSPGIILLLGMAERAASLGLRVIDLGRGLHFYKQRLMNGAVPIAEGEVPASALHSTVAQLRKRAKDLLRGPVRKLRGRGKSG